MPVESRWQDAPASYYSGAFGELCCVAVRGDTDSTECVNNFETHR
jgi:hypothetical protein